MFFAISFSIILHDRKNIGKKKIQRPEENNFFSRGKYFFLGTLVEKDENARQFRRLPIDGHVIFFPKRNKITSPLVPRTYRQSA